MHISTGLYNFKQESYIIEVWFNKLSYDLLEIIVYEAHTAFKALQSKKNKKKPRNPAEVTQNIPVMRVI